MQNKFLKGRRFVCLILFYAMVALDTSRYIEGIKYLLMSDFSNNSSCIDENLSLDYASNSL